MKKLVFLLALTTGITACGLAGPLIPAPLTLSTTDWVRETDSELDVSFEHPLGWSLIDSGTTGSLHSQYSTYGLKKQPITPAFRIDKWNFGAPLNQDEFVRVVTQSSYEGTDIVEELRETIQGFPAGGIRYSRKNGVGFVLMVGQPRQIYSFTWFSAPGYFSGLKEIYRAMLPTIRLGPPPP